MFPPRERDDFDAELTDLKKQFAYIEAAHQAACKDRDDLTSEVGLIITCELC